METEKNIEKTSNKPLFRDLNPDEAEPEITEIESFCINCEKNGITRIFLTKIPFYKDVVLMSFQCEHCGFQNNEIQNAGKIADKGMTITLKVNSPSDINRQVVKSDYTSTKIPHIDFEIPSLSQKGEITTVEGILNRIITGLQQDQERRRKEHPETAEKIDKLIEKIESLKSVEEPYEIIFEDISGNSFVSNPKAPLKDEACITTYFKRTKEQNHTLGIYEENNDGLLKQINEEEYTLEKIEGEVMTFPTNCPECNSPCETNMKMTNIPHFKQVVIMATVCDKCGLRTNEVKSGAGIEPEGIKIEIVISETEDFSRDVLKSETCRMYIPEIDLEVGPTTLGGRFSTVEGIITAIKDHLSSTVEVTGDSVNSETSENMKNFLSKLDMILQGKMNATLILDDPAGNSYIQSLLNDGPDDKLKITKYKRSFEQDDELGINDMKVDNY